MSSLQEWNHALDRTKIRMMTTKDSTFYSTICFGLSTKWDDTIPTAATDGKNLFINPEFFMELDEDCRLGLLMHETEHIAYQHMFRAKGYDFKKFNIAADHVINIGLLKRKFKLPPNGFADFQYDGMSVEEVYALIPDEETIDFTPDIIEGEGDTTEAQGEVQDLLIRAAIQSQINKDSPGSIPAEIQIFLNKLLNPKLPWNRILQKYLNAYNKSDYSFKKLNRRFYPKHILPGMQGECLMDIALFVDTSGSVTDTEFNQVISETHSIMKMMNPETIYFGQFDSSVKAVDTVKSLRDLTNVNFVGRGGTLIEPVIDWAKEHKPKLLLVFSDGYFNFYSDDYKGDVIWIIHNNPNFKPPYGRVIHYEA